MPGSESSASRSADRGAAAPSPGASHAAASNSDRSSLRADCEHCFALCCVVPAFSASADFAIDKPAGRPCPNLRADFGCSIHERLRPQGFPGCAVYDCFGAGQKVAQVTFGGRDWRAAPGIAEQMFQVFPIMRQLHELLWHLNAALSLAAASSLRAELSRAFEQTERLTFESPDALAALDIDAHWREVNALLLRASALARARSGGGAPDHPGADHRGADLIGRDLKDSDLRGASLRGASLIGADLRGADLTATDVTGADLRAADLSGADLAGSIFLTQSQLDAARGDRRTRVPASLTRPTHWLPPSGSRHVS